MYSNMCPPGFYCDSGTGDGSKYNKKCPEGYYCPSATQAYEEFIDSSSESEAATRCPRGTGNDSEDGKRELTECGIDSAYTLLTTGDIREEEEEDSSTARRNLAMKATKAYNVAAKRRGLQTASSELEEDLKDITEIEMSLHTYLDSDGDTTDELTPYINLDREYLARWNPINSTINEEIIFDIPALSYALVVMDLRALQDEYADFTYYEDWAVSFTIGENITEDSRAVPAEMPELFLRSSTDKNQVLEFQIFAWVDQKMRVDILLYNGLYFNMKDLFLNCASVEINAPNRAEYGTKKTFVAILVNEYGIGLPINAPPVQESGDSELPYYTVTFASNNNFTIDTETQNRIVTERGKNIYVPASLYWQERESINLPFLPFFSNCKGYGQYIPIWAITEIHYGCELIPVEETVFMYEYSFRQLPVADN